jgi:hypothetical protein
MSSNPDLIKSILTAESGQKQNDTIYVSVFIILGIYDFGVKQSRSVKTSFFDPQEM